MKGNKVQFVRIVNRASAMGAAALLLAAMTTGALAHAELLSAVPAADSAVATTPTSLTLTFSEDLEPDFSTVSLTGPGQAAVEGATSSVDPGNPAGMVVALPPDLPAGHYTVDWTAVATDGHKTTGSYSFDITK